MKKIRLGLIGAGWVARQHLESIKAVDWIETAGITSRTRSKAEQLASEYRIPACLDNLESLVQQTSPDALMILVSEDQLFNVTSLALRCKLPLFIEKPAGLSPEETFKLSELARQQSVPTMVGFNRRYYSIFRKGLDIICQHGPLLGVAVEGHERMWRIREGKKFSECVMENWFYLNSTHTIDLLRFFGGEVKAVKSIARRYIERGGDQFAAIVELESGAIGQYNAHWYSPGGWKVVLYGDGVTVEFKPLEKGFWTDKDFKTHEIEPDEPDVKFKPGFFRQLEAFGNLVRYGKSEWPMLDLSGAYKTMLLAKEIGANLSGDVTKVKENG